MRPLGLLALGGCGWISAEDRDRRMDRDQDGVQRPADCDDDDPAVSPRAAEVCDDRNVDEDCNGVADDRDPGVQGRLWWCADLDGDGLGDPATAMPMCDPLTGWVTDCTDPDDQGPGSSCGAPPVVEVERSAPALEVGQTLTITAGPATEGLTWTFVWGDGSSTTGSATADHAYDTSEYESITVSATDRCGQVGAAETGVAVADPGRLWVVTTGEDLDELQQRSGVLSLRQALSAAKASREVEVITFAPGIGPVEVGRSLPDLRDDGGMLVGAGVVLDGSPGGRIDLDGRGTLVAGLELVGFTDPMGAVRLVGEGSAARWVTVTGSAVGLRIDGAGAEVEGAVLRGNGDPQLDVRKSAWISAEVGEGTGDGIRVESDDVMLVRCLVHDNVGAGVSVTKHHDRVSILDSTLVRNEDGVRVDSKVDLTLENVILASNTGWGVKGAPTGLVDYDLWWDNAGECDGCEVGPHAVLADPLLDDRFVPGPASPAIDAGTPTTGVDKNGPLVGHWLGAAPDLGAFEVR